MVTISLVISFIILRIVHVYLFIKRVSRICHRYDWKYVDEFGEPLLDILNDKDTYYIKAEWSAYNFLWLKGPNPISFFFSLKPLTLEKQYSGEAIERLKKYELN